MSLVALWNSATEQLADKSISQLIVFAGDGKLRDGSSCSAELRSYLSEIPTKRLGAHATQCLAESFQDSGLALQDVVNEIGFRLGARVTRGRYRGVRNEIGFDGLWDFPSGHSIVIEVKTTDAYRIDLDIVAGYRDQLVDTGRIAERHSSMLLVVGRQDTGDLEAQIRGSRHGWDVRIISVDALLRLLLTKEEVESPDLVSKIHSILIPREFTRLDEIAEVLFSTSEDVREEVEDAEPDASPDTEEKVPKFKPVAFHEACITRVESFLSRKLIKRTRARYSTSDDSLRINCSVSKEHDPESRPNYWFAFHPHQKEYLEEAADAYVVFGCGSADRVITVPFREFSVWLEKTWITEKDDRFYWHVAIYREGTKYSLHLRKGEGNVDLTDYLLSAE